MASKKYLDYNGLSHLWEKIEDAVDDRIPMWNGNMLVNNDGDTNGFFVEYEERNLIWAWCDNGSLKTQIHYLATPTADTDAANKAYVDSAVSGITIPTKTSDLTNDSGFITTNDVPDEVMIVSLTYDDSYYANKTFSQIYSHLQAGGTAILSYSEDGMTSYYPIIWYDNTELYFADTSYDSNGMSYSLSNTAYSISSSNVITGTGASWTPPTITLNGASSGDSLNFYAPTTAGTSGQFLKSNGSGAPTWQTLNIPTVPTYTLSISNGAITLTGSDGSTTSASLPVYTGSVT